MTSRFAAFAIVLVVNVFVAGRADAAPDPAVVKRNAIVDFYNHQVPVGERSLGNYFKRFNPKTGPTCKTAEDAEKLTATLMPHPGKFESEVESLRSAAKAEPASPSLDAASVELATAFEALVQATDENWRYYDAEEHRKDLCKKSKTLHGKVRAAGARFHKAHAALYTLLRADEAKRGVVELKEIEARSGKGGMYWKKKAMIDARTAMDTIDRGVNLGLPTADPVRAALKKLDATKKAVAAYQKAHEDGAKESGFSHFAAMIDFFATAANQYADGLASGKADVDDVIGAYNRAVESSNRVRFGESFH